jgi:hypothetical protein
MENSEEMTNKFDSERGTIPLLQLLLQIFIDQGKVSTSLVNLIQVMYNCPYIKTSAILLRSFP